MNSFPNMWNSKINSAENTPTREWNINGATINHLRCRNSPNENKVNMFEIAAINVIEHRVPHNFPN